MTNETTNILNRELINVVEITSYPVNVDEMIHIKSIRDFINLYHKHLKPNVFHLHYEYDDGEETCEEYDCYIIRLTDDQTIVFME